MTRTKCFALFCVVLGVVLCSFALSENDKTANDCLSCHEKVYKNGISNLFPHSPFKEKQCSRCHLRRQIMTRSTASVIKHAERPTVLSRPEHLSEHAILLKGLSPQSAYDISIIFQDSAGHEVRQEFRGIVPANVRNVKTDDRKPPEISEVRVGPVVKGVFLETAITWETDEPSTSCVEYGYSSGQYGSRTGEDIVLVKQHRVNIHELEAGKDCWFRVRSEDIFGNESVSAGLVFNTGNVSPASDVEQERAGTEEAIVLAVNKSETFVLNSDLGLGFELTKPANMRVEYVKAQDVASESEPQVQAATTPEGTHAELREGKELAIDVCYQCHPPRDLGVSHPVGVAVKETTRVPEDLPTLEGGVITCVTCHDVHGGRRQYFARKKITKDICVSCHEGY